MRQKRISLGSLLAITLALFGCAPAEPAEPGEPSLGPTCTDAAISTCAGSQMVCAEFSDGAKCVACDQGSYIAADGTCTTIGGTPLVHDFPEQTIGGGKELIGFCRSWTLNNDEELWVNAVELYQTEHSHHANFVFVPDTMYEGPDDIWDRDSRGYEFYTAAVAGGVLYAQSTQATQEVQRFVPGAALRIPPHSRIVSDIHLLNPTSESITGNAKLTLYTIAAADVKSQLHAFHLEYDDLKIGPHSNARFTGSCKVAEGVSAVTGAPFAPKVHFLLPHTHSRATGFFATVLGGPMDGTSLLDLPGFNGEAHGRTFDPPVDVQGADGIQFGCQYKNPSNKTLGWGIGANEMCELFGFAENAPFFQARVKYGTGATAGSEGNVNLFKGDCVTEIVNP